MRRWIGRRTYTCLNDMLDAAIGGDFQETDYDESELSRLEVKWKRFLGASALSEQNVRKERERLQEFVSDISHQVKTPISNIKLYGEIISEKLPKEDEQLARRLLEQTELLEFLVQSLVKLSRLESGTIQVIPERQELLSLLEEVVERGTKKQTERGVKLKRIGWEPGICASYDRKWTAEAVYNILDNALKYTEENSTVTIEVQELEMFVRIGIQDEGPGVEPDEIPKLFGRFYRSTRFREKEGIGLGLFLAREILKKESGYIKIKSDGKHGAEFSVYLLKEPLL